MRKSLLAAGICVLGVGVWQALAQVNVVPQVGLITSLLKNPTYVAIAPGIVPASSATDIFCLNGSTTRNVHVTQVTVSGSAGTAITVPVFLRLNHSLDSGGTAYVAPTEIQAPVAQPLYPGDPAATATVTAYKANPTINDTAPAFIRSGNESLVTTSSGVASPPMIWEFSTSLDWFDKGADIAKAATVVQQYCVWLSGTSISSGVVNVMMEWTEAP